MHHTPRRQWICMFRGKGCLSNESKECFKVPVKILKDVANLRNKMKYKNIREIVLILLFVLDAMLWVVYMVKDKNRQSHIKNASILSSEKMGDQ